MAPSVEIIERDPMKFIGIETKFVHILSKDYNGDQVITPLWQKFLPLSHNIPNRIGDPLYAAIWGEPEEDRSHPYELHYLCAATVSSFDDVPDGMITYEVPAQTYAMIVHRGPISELGKTIEFLYRQWLPDSPWKHTGNTDIEVYDHRFDGCSEGSEFDYWISVEPKEED